MPNTIVPLEIVEGDVPVTKAAALWFTGLPATATGKELLAAVAKNVVVKYREAKEPPPPPAPPTIT